MCTPVLLGGCEGRKQFPEQNSNSTVYIIQPSSSHRGCFAWEKGISWAFTDAFILGRWKMGDLMLCPERLGSDHLPQGVVSCKQLHNWPWPFTIFCCFSVFCVSHAPAPDGTRQWPRGPVSNIHPCRERQLQCKSYFFLSQKQICALIRHLPELWMRYGNEVRNCDKTATFVHTMGAGRHAVMH